ncbi:MAG TPA: carbonic anhydrase family protein [Chthoniobacterales bacterium]|nr:carbonic anhydrase family protein [Chthoniobacterales bacterium]
MRGRHLFIIFLFAIAAFADEECPPRYSYCGYSGPAQWPNLPIEKNECGGTMQSPIDLATQTRRTGDAIIVKYKATTATIQNTGHDIKVTPTEEDPGEIKIGVKEYKLRYLHFHVPSEHRVPGVAALAEMHIVHQLKDGTDYAVIGVMLTRGVETYPALAPVFANLPLDVCAKPKAALPFNFDQLLPEKLSGYFTYAGSLTTPPCTQGVTWYVLGTPRPILRSELAKLRALGENARPIQRNTTPIPVTYVIAK